MGGVKAPEPDRLAWNLEFGGNFEVSTTPHLSGFQLDTTT